MIAVAVHAAAFAFSPHWRTIAPPTPPPPPEYLSWAWAPVSQGGGTGSPTLAYESNVASEEQDLADLEAELERRAAGRGGRDRTEGEAGLRDRLTGRGLPVPALAEPAREDEPEIERVVEEPPPADRETDGTSIDAEASAIDMMEGLESDLDLDRLSALRPELALVTPTAWVLIRNPTEVEAFLRRSYRSGELDPNATGSVGVTLWIDERGSVEWAEISRSSGRQDLDEFTLELFNEVVAFRPARERGVTVSRSVTFSVTYPW